jgi:N-carbamoyl-L-amino-acid hydrolase
MIGDALASMLGELEPVGRDAATGGYNRFAWTAEDLACREWFERQADARNLHHDRDQNGNLWAWFPSPPQPGGRVVAVGSHLDSVPGGGAFDGPLGVISAFLAVDELRRDQSWRQQSTIGVVDFADEEGARFGLACVGSRLLTGAADPQRVLTLEDAGGVLMAQAMAAGGLDPGRAGRDDVRLGQLASFVELHVEQGRALDDLGHPVGLATMIWPHGRWRIDLAGVPNHAGTTPIGDRRDPTIPLAAAVLAARTAAAERQARATVGRIRVVPNSTNSVPGAATAWLDARAADEASLEEIVAEVELAVRESAAAEHVEASMTEESRTPAVLFDEELRARLNGVLGGIPEIPTGAGHDAGILAAQVPTAMLFVRNRTGISHSPAEHADLDDCVAGVEALSRVLRELAG